jgi:hypothetical protein
MLVVLALLALTSSPTAEAQPSAAVTVTSCDNYAWSITGLPMPDWRAWTGIAAGHGNIYVVGGYNDGGRHATVDRAAILPDGTLGSWQTETPLPSARSGAAAVVAGDYLYALGGSGEDPDPLDIVERAPINPDGSLGSWETAPSLVTGRTHLAATVISNTILVAGGIVSNTLLLTTGTVERAVIDVSGELGAWTEIDDLAEPAENFQLTRSGDYLYAVGGPDSHVQFAPIIPAGLGPWQASTASPLPLSSGFAAGGFLYSVAFNDGDQVANLHRAPINPNGTVGAWVALPGPHSKPSFTPAVVAGDHVYLIGGEGAGFQHVVERAALAELQVAPGEHSMTINDGALFTNQVSVTLTIAAPPVIAAMQVSNDGGFANAQWEPCTRTRAWTITSLGTQILPRTVYVRFKDEFNVVSSVYTDDIILDLNPPSGTATLKAGTALAAPAPVSPLPAAALYSPAVDTNAQIFLPLVMHNICPLALASNATVHLSASDDNSGLGSVRLGNTSDLACGVWQTYAAALPWYLPPGLDTVYVQFRDNAGNVSETVTAVLAP